MSDEVIFWGCAGLLVLVAAVFLWLKRRRFKRHRAAWQIEAARKALEDDKTWQRPERSMPYQPPAVAPEAELSAPADDEPNPTPICPEPPPPRRKPRRSPKKSRARRPATVKQTKRLRAIKRRKK